MRQPTAVSALFLLAVFLIDRAVLPTFAGWAGGFPVDQMRLTALGVVVIALLRSGVVL